MERATDIINLIEKYDSRIKARWGNSFEMFKSPLSNKDFQAAKKSGESPTVRFIAYAPTEQVWIWNADNGLHEDVMNQLPEFKGKGNEYIFNHQMIWGVAKQAGSKWEMFSSDSLLGFSAALDFDNLIENFKWLERQINVSKWLKVKK